VQRVHQFNVWVRYYGEGKTVRVGEMTDDKAIGLASSVVTETFIYSVCSHAVHLWRRTDLNHSLW
jgi:hypothetical protein